MMTDITPILRRQAVHEIMADTGNDLDWFSQQIGFHVATARVWLARIQTNVPKIDRAVDAFLGRHEAEPRKAREKAKAAAAKSPHRRSVADGTKRCARCQQTKPRVEFGGTGYCLPCQRAYFRARDEAKRRKVTR